MKERLEPGPGFAIVGRWVFPSQNDMRHVLQADTYFLAPGDGLLFVGNGDNPEKPMRFKQSELVNILNETDPHTVQLLAIVEQSSGGLLFTDFVQQYGIGRPTPKDKRVMVASYGRITYAGIWGETKEEARSRLLMLQKLRLKRN